MKVQLDAANKQKEQIQEELNQLWQKFNTSYFTSFKSGKSTTQLGSFGYVNTMDHRLAVG
jgi:hypothetical protein